MKGAYHASTSYNICSNQAIARQNVDRIRHHLPIDTKPLAERITLLPYRLDNLDQHVNLIALTPGTSFNTASAEGIVEERIILYRMLTEAWGDLGHNARAGLYGLAQQRHTFQGVRVVVPEPGDRRKYRRAVQKCCGRSWVRASSRVHTRTRSSDGTVETVRPGVSGRGSSPSLDGLLAHACLDALEPDLVILDEFQRFRHLLNPKTTSGEAGAAPVRLRG